MSLWIKFAIGFVILIALAGAVAFYVTAGLTRAADGFFQAVARKNFPAARGYLAQAFNAGTNDYALQIYLATHGLTRFKEAHWSSRQIQNKRGSLRGTLISADGAVLPISLDLIRENGSWKIYAIQQPLAGLLSDASEAPTIPSPALQAALVGLALHDFALAGRQNDMTGFYRTLSQIWQRQTTPEKLNAALLSVTQTHPNLLELDKVAPVFTDDAAITAKGVMTLSGYKPLGGDRVYFEQRYYQEDRQWKLLGFKISVKAVATAGEQAAE